MKNLKTNWFLKHTVTVFSCVLIVAFGITFLSHADPVTTTIGENIATNDLSVTGNVTSGTWQGTAVGTQYGGTGQDWSAVAQGNLPYFSAEGALSNLAPGTAGQFLKSQGTGADPAWANVTRSATFVVAANDSSTLSKQQADYVCDGTDDQVEIQAAIDALPSGGGKVVLMEGDYSGSQINVSKNYMTIVGVGKPKYTASGSPTSVFHIIANYAMINSIYINGNATSHGVFFSGASYGIVKNSIITNCGNDCILMYDGATHITIENNYISTTTPQDVANGGVEATKNCTDIKIVGNEISDCGSGITIHSHTGETVNRILINDNFLHDNIKNGIRLAGTTDPVSDIIIANNVLEEPITDTAGIYVSAYNVQVVGNHLTMSGNIGIRVQSASRTIVADNFVSTSNTAIYLYTSNTTALSNNYLYDATATPLFVHDSDYVSITGGEIEQADERGIRWKDSDYGTISGVILKDNSQKTNNGYDDVYFEGTSHHNIITSCIFIATQVNKVNRAIEGAATATDNTATQNIFDGNQISDPYLFEPHTISHNTGYITESSGTVTLVNGTTSIVVTHGLAVTPSAGDITVTPIEAWGAMTEFYIDTYTSTQFTIHADQNPTQDVDFAWKAIVL